MKLVAAKCPNCGANIDVDKDSDTTKCEYCKSKIIVDDAIQKIKVEMSGKVEIANQTSFNKILTVANRYYLDKEYDEALKKYEKALELEPNDPLVILRLGICQTCLSSYANFDINKCLNAFKNMYKILKEKDDFSNYNSYIMETSAAIDNLLNKAINFQNNVRLSIDQVNYLIDNYIKCLNGYEYLYSAVRDNNNIKDRILSKINRVISILDGNFNCSSGYSSNGYPVYYAYKKPKKLKDWVDFKKNYYMNEYYNFHPESRPVKTNNNINKSFNYSPVISAILNIFWFIFHLIMMFACLGEELYLSFLLFMVSLFVLFPFLDYFFEKLFKYNFKTVFLIIRIVFIVISWFAFFIEYIAVYR